MKFPVDARKLLPHRGRMLLIDSVLTASKGEGTVLANPAEDSIMRGADGKIISAFYVELVAQAYAAVCGYDFIKNGVPIPEGYLVGIQRFEIKQNPSDAGDENFTITVKTIGDFDGLAVVEGSISAANGVVAEGKIKLFVPDSEEQQLLPETA